MDPFIYFIIGTILFGVVGLTILFILMKRASDMRLKKAKNIEKFVYKSIYEFFPTLTKDQLLDCLLIALDVPEWHMKKIQLIVIDREVTCGKLNEFIKKVKKDKEEGE